MCPGETSAYTNDEISHMFKETEEIQTHTDLLHYLTFCLEATL